MQRAVVRDTTRRRQRPRQVQRAVVHGVAHIRQRDGDRVARRHVEHLREQRRAERAVGQLRELLRVDAAAVDRASAPDEVAGRQREDAAGAEREHSGMIEHGHVRQHEVTAIQTPVGPSVGQRQRRAQLQRRAFRAHLTEVVERCVEHPRANTVQRHDFTRVDERRDVQRRIARGQRRIAELHPSGIVQRGQRDIC